MFSHLLCVEVGNFGLGCEEPPVAVRAHFTGHCGRLGILRKQLNHPEFSALGFDRLLFHRRESEQC